MLVLNKSMTTLAAVLVLLGGCVSRATDDQVALLAGTLRESGTARAYIDTECEDRAPAARNKSSSVVWHA